MCVGVFVLGHDKVAIYVRIQAHRTTTSSSDRFSYGDIVSCK